MKLKVLLVGSYNLQLAKICVTILLLTFKVWIARAPIKFTLPLSEIALALHYDFILK